MATMMLTKRSWVEIVHEILQMGGGKKTQIMYATALTYPQVVRYLDTLQERGLIELGQDEKQKPVYGVTERGRELLEHLDAAMGFLGFEEDDED
jgi:predicted transcriptional regulator